MGRYSKSLQKSNGIGEGKSPLFFDASLYKAPSHIEADNGNIAGLDPRNISRNDLLALGHPTSPIKAIRAHCVDCSGGSTSEARKCTVIDCPLWPLRMGVNVFHASARRS